jgi:multiple sugar transport system permease protein
MRKNTWIIPRLKLKPPGKKVISRLSVISALAVIAFFLLLPMVLTFLYSFMNRVETAAFMEQAANSTGGYVPMKLLPDRLALSNYAEILLMSTRFTTGFWNSVKYALLIAGGQLIVGTMAAFAFSRFRFRGRDLLFFVYVAIMMMPFQVTLVPNYIAIRTLNLLDTGAAVVLPGIFSAFGVFVLRQFMMNISDSLVEAAQIDGAGPFVIFRSMILPLSKTGMVALFVLSFIDTWNMVEQPLIFLKDIQRMPLTILIRMAMDQQTEIVFTPAVLYMVPAILIYFIFKESLAEGVTRSWLKTGVERGETV